MKKIKKIIYELSEDEQEAIGKVYNLLKEIHCDASVNDMIGINEGDICWYEYKGLQILYEGLLDFSAADYITLMRKD